MKKEKFTIDDHIVLGKQLKKENDYYVDLFVKIANSFPKNSKQVNTVRKIIKNLTELRSVMDDILGDDYPSEFSANCYYGQESSNVK